MVDNEQTNNNYKFTLSEIFCILLSPASGRNRSHEIKIHK